MLWPVQSLQALVYWHCDLIANFGVSDLDEELYGNGNKQCHGGFDEGTSAETKNIYIYYQLKIAIASSPIAHHYRQT
jgi:hypothetical protein